ncbi:MAG: hypothetical protein JTJ24_10125 [Collinsella sp.]|nr:hypothetical protein [Collinsella sp.]
MEVDVNYRLDVFRDAALSERVERLSLSARSDAQAVEQAEAARWRCECAGESRVLVLSRGGREVAKLGSRRLGGFPRWSVTVLVEDGSWVPVEVEAETMADALDYIYSLDWVENVVECLRTPPAPSVGDAVEFETSRFGVLRGTVADVGHGRERACDIMVERHPETGRPCMWKNVPGDKVRPTRADG